MIKISVIVPVYNGEKYIKRCLDSLVNQTLREIEIIIINDCSTDKTQDIINDYKNKYKNIKSYINKKNVGQGESRNFAINKSKGNYIIFVDADDCIEVTMIEKLYNKSLIDNSDIVASTKYIELNKGEKIEKEYKFYSENQYLKYILNNFGPWNKLIKKEIIINNNLYFPKLRAYEDISVVPLWGIYSKKISFIDEALYYYLIHDGSTMKQVVYNEKLTHIYKSLDNLSYKMKFKSKNKYKKEIEWIYIEHLLHAASLRFLKFNKIDEIKKINKIINNKFPNWFKNKYYKKQNLKFKIVCNLIYKEKFLLLKYILKNR